MELELIIISALAGIAVGLRHNFLLLVPAVTLAALFAMMAGIARAEHLWSIVLGMAMIGTAVQFGYLAGITIRTVAGSIWAPLIGGRNPEIGRI